MRLSDLLTKGWRFISGGVVRVGRALLKWIAATFVTVGRWVGRLFLLILLFGVPVAMVAAFVSVSELRESSIAIPGIRLALSVVLGELGALVVYLTIRTLLRLLRSPLVFGSAGSGTRLTAFFVALTFFRDLPTACARAAITAGSALVFGIPFSLGTSSLGNGDVDHPSSISLDLTQVGSLVLGFIQRAMVDISGLGSSLRDLLDLSRLLLFLILWVLVVHALQELQAAKVPDHVRAFVAHRPALNWSNVGFVVILSASLFLSLAAIASFPRLRERYEANPEVSPETLQQTLQRLQTTKERLDGYASTNTSEPGVPVSAPSAATSPAGPAATPGPTPPKTPAQPTPASAAPTRGAEARAAEPPQIAGGGRAQASDEYPAQWFVANLKTLNRGFTAEIDTLRDQQRTLTDRILDDQARALDSATNQFRYENLDRRGSPEERDHFLNIRNWFDSRVRLYVATSIDCAKRKREVENMFAEWMRATERLIEGLQSPTAYPESLSGLSSLPYQRLWEAQDVCSIPAPAPVPPSPPLGARLGVLSYVAQWLLRTGSVSLAAITGMIGFGLLGAVISTFVRERLATAQGGTSQATGKPYVFVSDLMGVALRGLSAAVVVFLAVQGGLAVFAGDQSDPNPYVLLLACLVAAVFSESVWARAYDYLAEKMRGSPQTGVSALEDATQGAAAPGAEQHANPTSDSVPTPKSP